MSRIYSNIHGDVISPCNLSERQKTILSLRAESYLNKQIAGILGIAESTVKEHITIALKKLNKNTVVQAVAELTRNQII